jgi:hypothetical protein
MLAWRRRSAFADKQTQGASPNGSSAIAHYTAREYKKYPRQGSNL